MKVVATIGIKSAGESLEAALAPAFFERARNPQYKLAEDIRPYYIVRLVGGSVVFVNKACVTGAAQAASVVRGMGHKVVSVG